MEKLQMIKQYSLDIVKGNTRRSYIDEFEFIVEDNEKNFENTNFTKDLTKFFKNEIGAKVSYEPIENNKIKVYVILQDNSKYLFD